MSDFQLVQIPSKVLYKKARRVTNFSNVLMHIKERMISVMRENNGIGLAANQIGLRHNMFIVGEKEFINAKITKKSPEMVIHTEGCLSIPDQGYVVSRYKEITVKYQDLKGVKHEEHFTDLEAIVIQHEIDHLRGRTLAKTGVKRRDED